MRSLFAWFVDRSMLVNLLTVATLLFGVATFLDVPRTLMPAVQSRVVTVQADLPGAAAVDVERLVTFRLEEVLQDLRGLDELVSTTVNGSTSLVLTFDPDHDAMAASVEQAKTRIRSLQRVLPRELEPVRVEHLLDDRMPGPSIHLRGADAVDPEHRRAVDLLTEQLRRIPAVVQVPTSMPRLDLHVTFHEDALADVGLDVTAARARVGEFLRFAPVGQLRHVDRTVAIELDQGFDGLDSLRVLPLNVNRAGRGVTLGDVATVELRHEDTRRLHLLDGEPYVEVSVLHAAESDAIRVSERVRQVVDAFDQLPDGVTIEVAEDPSEFITHELGILQSNALAGFAIVLGILLLFLGWRIAAMTAIGLPFCYLGGIVVLDAMGITFNLISLFALILVLGILVDDAIIVAEAFAVKLEEGSSPREAAIEAASRMFRPVVGMMLTTVVAFLPMLLVGAQGTAELVVLPIVVLTMLTFSLVESFFVLPNHLRDFMPATYRLREWRPVTAMRAAYRTILRGGLRVRYLTLPAFVGVMLFAGYLLVNEMEIKGSKSLGDGLIVHVELYGSDSLEQTRAAVAPIERALLELQGTDVRFVQTVVGESTPNRDRTLEGFRYASIEAVPPGSMAEAESHFAAIQDHIAPVLAELEASGRGRAVAAVDYQDQGRDVVKIFVSGTDRIDFEAIEQRVRQVLTDVEGVDDVSVDPERLQETWRFVVDHREVLTYDLTTAAVADQLREYVPGPYLERVRVRGQEMLVFTHFDDDLVPDALALDAITVTTPRGIAVPVTRLGSWERVETMRRIQHKDLLRVFEVDARFDPETIDSEDVAAAIEGALAPVRAEWPGFHISVEEPRIEQEFQGWALKVGVISVGLIYVITALTLGSLVEPLLVLIAIPFGLTGVVLALYAHGMDFEVMAIVGVIGLVGVVVNDSLVVMDTIRREREASPDEPYLDVLVRGADRRFQAVVLTSLTTLGGVVPLAYGLMGDAGWIQPMVFALGWGLVFATLLTLLLLPAMLAALDDVRRLLGRLIRLVRRQRG